MATVAALSIFPKIGEHPVGLFPLTRNNPLAAAKPTAIPGAFATGSPILSASAQNVPTITEHYFLAQFTSSVDIIMTEPGGNPNAPGLVVQTILVPASGQASYGVIMPPGYNEIHVRSTT